MTEQSDAIARHLQACKDLIAAAVHQLRDDDLAAYQGVALASRQGAAFRVTTSLSAAGLCEASVDLVAPDGTVANVAQVALESPGAAH